jgi:hypothetical protein
MPHCQHDRGGVELLPRDDHGETQESTVDEPNNGDEGRKCRIMFWPGLGELAIRQEDAGNGDE